MTDSNASGARATVLVRALGVWGLAAGIVNITVGGGIFRLPAGAAAVLGAAAPIAYIICALAMGLIVVCFAQAGSRVALTGGLYAYVEVAFGGTVGFISGFVLWVGITTAFAAIATVFADSVGSLVPAFSSPLMKNALLVTVIAGLVILNIRGIRGASRFNTVATAAKLIPLLLLVILGARAIVGSNLSMGPTPPVASVARASAFLIFAFLGIETALVPSGEVRDPSRTVPRAIALAMIGVTVLYLAVQVVAQGVLGASLAASKTPLADAASIALGDWGRRMILVGAVVSVFGFLSGMTLAVPRMLYAFARDGFLPARLASIHPKFRTPHVAIIIQALIVVLLAVTGSFERLAILANATILLVYAACSCAAWELARRDVRTGGPPLIFPGSNVIPPLALLIIVWLLSSLTKGEMLATLAVIAVAVPLCLASQAHRRTFVRQAE